MPKPDRSISHRPRKVGRYLLHREIAHGGMATVHVGRLLGQVGFSRTVAIKRMHEHCARDPDFVSMFIDEARLAARVRHPNVVPTLDVVVLDGELFLVMEFVQGETLARLIRRSFKSNVPIAPRVASAVIAGALEGLHAAHEAVGEHGEPLGIVHRDVSPHNVMVGNDGIARVLDFGVAKATNRLQTTRDGQIKGKVEYMAPEQLRGSLVDRRTDVYAAACCLWEMLTGRRLYTADNPVALWGKVLEGNAARPSSVVAQVPRALDEITMRGLEADPTLRYQTAEAMAIALEQEVGIATPREVGRWVEALAGKALRERASLVAELDTVTSDITWNPEDDDACEIASVVSQVSSKRSAPPPQVSEPPIPSRVKRSSEPAVSVRIPRPSSGRLGAVPANGVVPPPPATMLPATPLLRPQLVAPPTPQLVVSQPVQLDALPVDAFESEPCAPAISPQEVDVAPVLPMRHGPPVGLIAAGVAGVILLLGAGGWFWMNRGSERVESTSTVVEATSSAPAPTPTPESTATAATSVDPPAPPKKVSLRIVVIPETATVNVDGKPVEARELEFVETSDPVRISAQAQGYETLERHFVPTSDGSVVLELKPRPAQTKSTQTKPTATVKIKGPVETEL